jgi:hypothetical protein
MDLIKQSWGRMEKGLIGLLILFVLVVFGNFIGIVNWTIPCAFQHLFNIECFGCGTTDAIKLAFQGKWLASLHSNPLGIMLILYLLIRTSHLTFLKLKRV